MGPEHPFPSAGLKRLIDGLSAQTTPEPERLLALVASAGVTAEELGPGRMTAIQPAIAMAASWFGMAVMLS